MNRTIYNKEFSIKKNQLFNISVIAKGLYQIYYKIMYWLQSSPREFVAISGKIRVVYRKLSLPTRAYVRNNASSKNYLKSLQICIGNLFEQLNITNGFIKWTGIHLIYVSVPRRPSHKPQYEKNTLNTWHQN